jgi:hypothetical protein
MNTLIHKKEVVNEQDCQELRARSSVENKNDE